MAALAGDPARASMLNALMDGRWDCPGVGSSTPQKCEMDPERATVEAMF